MSAAYPFDAAHLIAFHEACLDSGKWPDEEAPAHPPGDVWPWVEENHACNARLRRAAGEDDARTAAAFQARREEAIRRVDAALSRRRAPGIGWEADRPGTLADRLSLLALELRGAAGGRGEALAAERAQVARRLDALLFPPRPEAQ